MDVVEIEGGRMKHKVKIFEDTRESSGLEEDINKWIETNPGAIIVDIKYSTSHCCRDNGWVYYSYSALIHYGED